MKFVLISDSHGNKQGIDRIFSDYKFDYLFFMGDGLGDLGTYYNLENVIAVSGNCDFFSSVPNEKIIQIDGNKILITHGNKYGVKSGLGRLIEYAESEHVKFVFFGHTHKETMEEINGIYYINPGSFHKNSSGESCGLEIVISDGDFSIKHLKLK